MEPEDSLPRLETLLRQFHLIPNFSPYFSNLHFHIIHVLPHKCLLLRYSYQNFIRISHSPPVPHVIIWGMRTEQSHTIDFLIYGGRLKSSWTHPIIRVGTLWRCSDGLFRSTPLANCALLTALHALLENVLQIVCRKLQDSGTRGFLPRSSLFMVGKAQKSHGPRLYGRCSNGVPPMSVSATIATFQSRNADAPRRLLRHLKKGPFKTTVTLFSRSGWSVVRSESLAKGGNSKERPSPHLHKVPTRSNKVSKRPSYDTLSSINSTGLIPLYTRKSAPLNCWQCKKSDWEGGGGCKWTS
jgi:hypothetical protein